MAVYLPPSKSFCGVRVRALFYFAKKLRLAPQAAIFLHSNGQHRWSPDTVPGGAAASLETGVPQMMMSMLIRAGLPSRRAAIIAIRDGEALFIDGAEMREWIQSPEIVSKTKSGKWPTSETA